MIRSRYLLFLPILLPFIGNAQKKHASKANITRAAYFPGGNDSVKAYIERHLRYPENAREDGIDGRVTIRVVINELGVPEQITILRSISKECDAEAIRVIKGMPHWQPALYKGKPGKAVFVVPIEFRLE